MSLDGCAYAYKAAAGAVKPSAGLLCGAVLTAAGAAQVSLRDGGATATQIVTLRLGAAGSVAFLPPTAIAFGTTLHLTVEAGTVEVCVYYV